MLRTIILLAGVVSTILFPILGGHALSTHESGPMIGAFVMLGVGIVLLAIAMRLPDPHTERH